jgi:hypothetical protein
MNKMNLLALLLLCSAVHVDAADSTQSPAAAATVVMDNFLAAFNARDESAWAETLHFPHVRIASGQVLVYPTRSEFVAAMDLDVFAESTGWDHSTWDEMTVIQASAYKVHITVTFSRFNAAGKKISTFDSLYVVENVGGRWGIRARSSFAP